jgi:hypothetical protein
MFVQVFAGPEAEREAIAAQDAKRGCELRHDRWVIAQRWASHGRGEADSLCARCYRAQHSPGERRVTLASDPGMEVIGDRDEVEAELFRAARVVDELSGPVFLTHEFVSEGWHTHELRNPHAEAEPSWA